MPSMCEVCSAKRASFGIEGEGKMRWCASCGKARGAISLRPNRSQNMCEVCSVKRANFGTEGGGKKRWCAKCGKARGAISLLQQQMCEVCSVKQASFGIQGEVKKRWCGPCGKARGAICLQHSAKQKQKQAKAQAVPKVMRDQDVGSKFKLTRLCSEAVKKAEAVGACRGGYHQCG